jgi:hypothetical protein
LRRQVSIQRSGNRQAASEEEINRVRAFGQGRLCITEHRLGNLATGKRARFEHMRFEVELFWPTLFAPAGE